MRLPHKSIMIVRAQADSVSNSESVHVKKRRKRLCRLVELDRKGAFEKGSPIQLSVRFSEDVGVREFATGIGDHPSVSGGVPICLTGDCKREYICPIHDLDDLQKADIAGLAIPAKEREMMLYRQGCSWKDIHNAVIVTNRMIAQRRKKKKAHWDFVSKGLEYLVDPFRIVPKRVQNKLMRASLELSRREKIQYDLEEEAILLRKLDENSMSDSLKSIYIGDTRCFAESRL